MLIVILRHPLKLFVPAAISAFQYRSRLIHSITHSAARPSRQERMQFGGQEEATVGGKLRIGRAGGEEWGGIDKKTDSRIHETSSNFKKCASFFVIV